LIWHRLDIFIANILQSASLARKRSFEALQMLILLAKLLRDQHLLILGEIHKVESQNFVEAEQLRIRVNKSCFPALT